MAWVRGFILTKKSMPSLKLFVEYEDIKVYWYEGWLINLERENLIFVDLEEVLRKGIFDVIAENCDKIS
ncbi:MAG: hypothetical protein C0172_02840 [Caldisphaera sp.]|nr:MAG: hypothetical protein C0172_02840 [Caldisphaera sp.]